VALFFPLIVPILSLVLVGFVVLYLYRTVLYLLVWILWLPKGKDVLFVNSDSPVWHEFMETEVLPLVQDRAVMLNWSHRKTWPNWSLAVRVFRHFGGSDSFNPLVIVFRPIRGAQKFRFWRAFKDWKRGYREPVERLRQELLNAL
jgi:hypothetical protein